MPNATNMSAMTLATHGITTVQPTIHGAGGAVSGDYYHVLSARPPRDRTSFANTATSAPLGPSAQSVSRADQKIDKCEKKKMKVLKSRQCKPPPRQEGDSRMSVFLSVGFVNDFAYFQLHCMRRVSLSSTLILSRTDSLLRLRMFV